MPYLNYGVVEKLLEWQFDIYGLIEANLAININTLEQAKPFKNMVMYTEKDFAKFKKKPTQWYDEKLEERINIIGQNGNDGEHYNK